MQGDVHNPGICPDGCQLPDGTDVQLTVAGVRLGTARGAKVHLYCPWGQHKVGDVAHLDAHPDDAGGIEKIFERSAEIRARLHGEQDAA